MTHGVSSGSSRRGPEFAGRALSARMLSIRYQPQPGGPLSAELPGAASAENGFIKRKTWRRESDSKPRSREAQRLSRTVEFVLSCIALYRPVLSCTGCDSVWCCPVSPCIVLYRTVWFAARLQVLCSRSQVTRKVPGCIAVDVLFKNRNVGGFLGVNTYQGCLSYGCRIPSMTNLRYSLPACSKSKPPF